jgi:hypothetical protein
MKKYIFLIFLTTTTIYSCKTVKIDKYPQLQKKGYASFSAKMGTDGTDSKSYLKNLGLRQEINGKKVFLRSLTTPNKMGCSSSYFINCYNVIASAPPGKATFYFAKNEIIIDIEENMITNVVFIISNKKYIPNTRQYTYDVFYSVSKPVSYSPPVHLNQIDE